MTSKLMFSRRAHAGSHFAKLASKQPGSGSYNLPVVCINGLQYERNILEWNVKQDLIQRSLPEVGRLTTNFDDVIKKAATPLPL